MAQQKSQRFRWLAVRLGLRPVCSHFLVTFAVAETPRVAKESNHSEDYAGDDFEVATYVHQQYQFRRHTKCSDICLRKVLEFLDDAWHQTQDPLSALSDLHICKEPFFPFQGYVQRLLFGVVLTGTQP